MNEEFVVAADVRFKPRGTSIRCLKGLGALIVLGLVSGCSVGMALSGNDEPDLGAINVGTTRGQVQMQLGSPTNSVTHEDGRRTDIYEYEMDNEPSAGRAIGHGVMDFLTLGAWEVIGTPIEGFQGESYRATITYDRDDKVLDISSTKT